MDRDRTEVVETLSRVVALLGWRIREGDEYRVVLLPPLARSNPDRDRWPGEPRERYEARLRDRLGNFDPDGSDG